MKVKEAKISQKGQITVPKEVREILGVDSGDKVAFYIESDNSIKLSSTENIEVTPKNKLNFFSSFGLFSLI